MRRWSLVLALATVAAAPATPALVPSVDVPFQSFTLKNGLRVVVHEDHKAPIVAVSIWYGVGSRDEPVGRTGFAHLFEHLMFQASENHAGEFFAPFEAVGATDMNGTTWFDRTNYFENVPTPALELALWMESDRMGHLLGAVDQKALDEQRGVVQNEKRQGDNEPYGKLEYQVLAGVFPEGHPYRHSTIGSMDDLNAASLDDVKTWFQTYYGAANTVLVLAGDTNVATARPLIEKYFADIGAGGPLSKIDAWVPTRAENVLETMYDRVPQTRIHRVWAVPGRITKDRALLELAAATLGRGKNSRLYKELVYDKQLCTTVSVEVEEHQLASLLSVDLVVAPGKDAAAAQAAADAVLATFLKEGPTAEELGRARVGVGADRVRGLEKIGGFGGKAVALAEGALYANDPAFFLKQQVDWMNAATPADVGAVARSWMSKGYYQASILPFDDGEVAKATADRSKLPMVGAMPALAFPAVVEGKLNNGMKVVLAERHAAPVVEVAMLFDAGYAADPREKLGLALFTASLTDAGTTTRSALALSGELDGLGARLSTRSSLDATTVRLSALSGQLQPSLAVYADVLRNPAFDPAEIERQRARSLAAIAQEKAQPRSLAMRLMPPELFGSNHPYGVPLSGSGDEATVKSITRADVQKFQQGWLRPDNATLFVVGDTTMAQILPMLNAALGDWKPAKATAGKKVLPTVALPVKSRVILLDKPGAEQSLVLAGLVGPSSKSPDEVAISAMNDVIGGQFTARINMNLREDKHWAYGAYSMLIDAAGQRPVMAFAPVQTDKTAESMAELSRELKEFVSSKPATADELKRVVENNVNGLPGEYETANAVMGSLLRSATYGRAWNYPTTLPAAYGKLGVDKIRSEAKDVWKPDQLVWVVVGDRSKIEAGVRALNLGDVTVRSLE